MNELGNGVMMKKWSVLSLLLLLVGQLFAQRKSDFAMMEDSIIHIHQTMFTEPSREIRYQKNEQLLALLEETLLMKNSFNYKFDSLKTISVLTSPDNKFRVFTWFVVDNLGNYEHFGFLQTYNEREKRYMLFPLEDKWNKIRNPATQPLNHTSWFGALYYRLIETKTSAKTYYTLLGWNGGDVFSQRKIIEVVELKPNGIPIFGAPIFRNYSRNIKYFRIVFQYAKHSQLSLDYSQQYCSARSKKKNKRMNRYTYDTIPIGKEIIVFNRLIPMDETLTNVPAYYVGESSLNDGFIEKEGRWYFMRNVVALNSNPSKKKNRANRSTPADSTYKPTNRIFYQPIR